MERVVDSILYILSETDQRAKVFKSLLGNKECPFSKIILINRENIQSSLTHAKEPVCLVDLISYKDSSKRIIKQIKSNSPNSKLIAIHIYRTPLLIKPLFDLGIDGYIHSDPSRKELLNAIDTVKNGKVYQPKFLTDSKNT